MVPKKYHNYRWLIGLICIAMPVFASDKLVTDQVFSTWDAFEVDKCASMWLIKRYIAPDAEIRIMPKGTRPLEGIKFDVPDAKFRRTAKESTFGSLMTHYKIVADTLEYLRLIVHAIEIKIWELKRLPESRKIEGDILQKTSSGGGKTKISNCFSYFDEWIKAAHN
jgi:hypothetical protein